MEPVGGLKFNLSLTHTFYLLDVAWWNIPLALEEVKVASALKAPQGHALKARPSKQPVDRQRLREEINARYENTLRYLGR